MATGASSQGGSAASRTAARPAFAPSALKRKRQTTPCPYIVLGLGCRLRGRSDGQLGASAPSPLLNFTGGRTRSPPPAQLFSPRAERRDRPCAPVRLPLMTPLRALSPQPPIPFHPEKLSFTLHLTGASKTESRMGGNLRWQAMFRTPTKTGARNGGSTRWRTPRRGAMRADAQHVSDHLVEAKSRRRGGKRPVANPP